MPDVIVIGAGMAGITAAKKGVLSVYPGVVNTPFFTAEMLERMPASSRRSMVEPEGLVEAIFGALAKGKRELTYPGGLAAGYVVRALAPGFLRKQVLRVTKGPRSGDSQS